VTERNGEVNAIFVWWDMIMGKDPESGEPITISCRPKWAGNEEHKGVWRYHWQHSAYYGFKPLSMYEGNSCFLESYRGLDDSTGKKMGLWFKITRGGFQNTDMNTIILRKKVKCTCYFHELIPQDQFAMQGDPQREQMVIKILKELIMPGVTNIIFLDDAPIVTPVIAIALGAKCAFVTGRRVPKLVTLITQVLEENHLPKRIMKYDLNDKSSVGKNKVTCIIIRLTNVHTE
jgi:hypothetical protein